LRIALILGGFSLVYFGLAITLETFIIAVVLGYIFFRKEPLFDFKKIRFDFKKSLTLLNASWIFLLLGFFNTIMLNIDKIMLEKMTGNYEVGLYSAISWLSFSFIILADYITTSTYPVLIKLDKDTSFEHYAADFQKFLNYMALLAYAIIITIVLSSNYVVQALWGSEYKASAYLLSIQIFSILPYFTGLIVSRWVIINNYIKFHAIIYFCGALINILLNYFLIKRFGIIGVPFSTVITYFWINIIAYYLSPKTKHLASMQLKAIFMLQFFHRISKKY
jgi:O-antigen/teichoic acid export membrane protein